MKRCKGTAGYKILSPRRGGCTVRIDQKDIDQRSFFNGLGFVEHEIYGILCYEGPDGCLYRMDHFDSTYVIECAEDEADAQLHRFEDADRFDDDLPEAELIEQVQAALRAYVAE